MPACVEECRAEHFPCLLLWCVKVHEGAGRQPSPLTMPTAAADKLLSAGQRTPSLSRSRQTHKAHALTIVHPRDISNHEASRVPLTLTTPHTNRVHDPTHSCGAKHQGVTQCTTEAAAGHGRATHCGKAAAPPRHTQWHNKPFLLSSSLIQTYSVNIRQRQKPTPKRQAPFYQQPQSASQTTILAPPRYLQTPPNTLSDQPWFVQDLNMQLGMNTPVPLRAGPSAVLTAAVAVAAADGPSEVLASAVAEGLHLGGWIGGLSMLARRAPWFLLGLLLRGLLRPLLPELLEPPVLLLLLQPGAIMETDLRGGTCMPCVCAGTSSLDCLRTSTDARPPPARRAAKPHPAASLCAWAAACAMAMPRSPTRGAWGRCSEVRPQAGLGAGLGSPDM